MLPPVGVALRGAPLPIVMINLLFTLLGEFFRTTGLVEGERKGEPLGCAGAVVVKRKRRTARPRNGRVFAHQT